MRLRPVPWANRALLPLLAVAAVLTFVTIARADDGDSAKIPTGSLFVGQQTTLVLQVVTNAGATVEVDPSAESWNGVQVIRLGKASESVSGGRTLHRLEVVVAPFLVGDRPFTPAINVIEGGQMTPRSLPSVALRVATSLGPNPALELRPLPAPRDIAGAESPLLRPAIGAGAVLALAALGAAIYFAWRAMRRLVRRRPALAPSPSLPATIAVTEQFIESDPVSAYRQLAATVRAALARRYGLPAQALTTLELRRRLASDGIDRFQGKLVGNLLDECDAVVYAGYRPATERRHADLNMAREIVEGAG
jgi:hypothetical protein